VHSGFVSPSWDAPIDVPTHVNATPEGATIKGMFPAGIVAACELVGPRPKHAHARYLAFADYPLREYALLLVEAARVLHPRLPLRSGLRKIGRASQPTFERSMVGKVIFGAMHDVPTALDALVKAYGVAMPSAAVEVREVAEGRALVHLGGVTTFLDSHHVGVFEGIVRSVGLRAEISVKLSSISAGEFLLEWPAGERYENTSSIT
jgi:uncharacterized protein (TIGR02265 family)